MWNGIGRYDGFIGPTTSTTDISLNANQPTVMDVFNFVNQTKSCSYGDRNLKIGSFIFVDS